MGPDGQDRWAVGLCTYKRPAGLARVIEHVGIAAARLGRPVQLIVVDNDGQDAAIEALARDCADRAGLPLIFVVETTPGISAARNAVFAAAAELDIRFMAMLDDDEWPDPQWLVLLDVSREKTHAHIVGGPVKPVFPEDKQDLQAIARWWSVRPQLLEGKPFVFCTCNFLIDLAAIRARPRPLFEPEFGLSGGGDVIFFRSLFFAGHPMAWADDAVVLEEVPPLRASLAWMRQRRFRIGNHAANWEIRDQGAARTIAKTVALTARLAIYPLISGEAEARATGWLLEMEKIRGRWSAVRGGLFKEYARPEGQAPVKDCR